MKEGTPSRDQAARGPASSFETIAGDMNLGVDRPRAAGATTVGGKKQKICCACGKDVAHEERFKDRAGFYWCMDCGVQEHRTKHALAHPAETATCPDCSQAFPPEQFVEYDNLKLCPQCADKRRKSAEREAARQAARKAAIAQEIIDAEKRRRRLLLITVIAATLAVIWAVYTLAK